MTYSSYRFAAYQERKAIAANPSTSVSLLETLIEDPDSGVRCEVVRNESCPPHLLAKAALDDIAYVRSAVAEHPNTPEESLRGLSSDRCHTVRSAVAYGPNTPTEILKDLMQDKNPDVQRAAERSYATRMRMQESSAGPQELQALAEDSEVDTRLRVARNILTPDSVLQKLASDPEFSVRFCALHQLEQRGKLPKEAK